MTLPVIKCCGIQAVELDDWPTLEALFAKAEFAPLQQGWVECPTADFRPGQAAAVWTERSLIVFADLNDREIFNDLPVSEFNRLALAHGDVFEIFLQPARQQAYYELHVTPVNQKFQLRIPYPGAFNDVKKDSSVIDPISQWVVSSPVFESRIRLLPAAERWQAVVEIPFAMVMENGVRPQPGDHWLFSFSRYDRDRGKPDPVYSSSSPHPEINYHRVQDWGTLIFA